MLEIYFKTANLLEHGKKSSRFFLYSQLICVFCQQERETGTSYKTPKRTQMGLDIMQPALGNRGLLT